MHSSLLFICFLQNTKFISFFVILQEFVRCGPHSRVSYPSEIANAEKRAAPHARREPAGGNRKQTQAPRERRQSANCPRQPRQRHPQTQVPYPLLHPLHKFVV